MPPNDSSRVVPVGGSTINRTDGVRDPATGRIVAYGGVPGGRLVPIYDLRNPTKVVGYKDIAGNFYDVHGKRLPKGAPQPAESFQQEAQAHQATIAAKEQAASKAKATAAAQAQQGLSGAAAAANQELGHVWVDGKQLTISSVNADGSWNATIGASKERPLSGWHIGSTAFDALDTGNGSNFSSDTRFTMNAGAADIFTGRMAGDGHGYFGGDGTLGAPNYTPNRPGALNPASAGEYSADANQVSNSTNMMTVGQGLTWLVNLSIKDPGAYQAFVDQLHKANYLSDADYATAGGAYGPAVGQAFASAATDTSVINGQAAGFHTTLFDVLNQRAAAAEAAKANTYKPVQRTYTDPAALEAAARSLAQSDLGRDLTSAEVAQLTGHFRGLEDGMYDQMDAAGRQGNNASVVNPNPTGQVDTFIHDGPMAQEAANWHVAQYGAALRKLFGL